MYANKTILVTGGTGSIGSELVRQLLPHNPKEIRVFEFNENSIAAFRRELADTRVSFVVGDIRDRERLDEAVAGVDIIFHAAAMKHVDICEYNPQEAIKTNVIGTGNIIACALRYHIQNVVLISTDKAANPTNTMGATKMLAERLIAEADTRKQSGRPAFCSVRFGNVLGSAGSVVPLFRESIEKRRSVAVTDEQMTRFVLTIPEAARLVLEAAALANGGETFILKMHSLRLGDLVDVMIEVVSKKCGFSAAEVRKEVIGLRPGEKIHEDLISETEWSRTLETDKLYIVLSPLSTMKAAYPGARRPAVTNYNSANNTLLTKEQIRQLLEKENLV